jgi:hypothetical protein
MALATNSRDQMAKRLQANLALRFPGYTIAASNDANGNPALILTNGSAVDVAAMSFVPRSFNGFNVVAELSSSAAVGLPETILMLAIRSDASQSVTSQIAMTAKGIGTSSMTLAFPGSATVANAIDATQQVVEFVNDARYGAAGQ